MLNIYIKHLSRPIKLAFDFLFSFILIRTQEHPLHTWNHPGGYQHQYQIPCAYHKPVPWLSVIIPPIKCTTAPKNYSAALEIILLIWSLCKYLLVRRSPCKIGGVLVRNLLRKSPCKLFLERVIVTLPGVFVSYEDSL